MLRLQKLAGMYQKSHCCYFWNDVRSYVCSFRLNF